MSWWKRWKPKISGTISGTDLQQKIFKKYHVMPITTDRVYQIPADPGDVTWKCSPFDLPYVPEKRDCDDYVRMARGWLSRKCLGNLLVMDCHIKTPAGGSHAVLGFLGPNDEIIFGEPQTGRILDYDQPVKIYRIVA